MKILLIHIALLSQRFIRSLEGLEPIFKEYCRDKRLVKSKLKIYFDNHLFLGFKKSKLLLNQYL
jgi:hypothetical protein